MQGQRFSGGKMTFQSFFMSTTVHLFAACARKAWAEYPEGCRHDAAVFSFGAC
jgi:hypothetical protein